MGELSRLNYALKPKFKMHADTSFETQNNELFYMCGQNRLLMDKFARLLAPFSGTKSNYPILFTRQACLFAMEEVIHSDLTPIEGFTMAHSWEKLLNYLLAVNSVITRMDSEDDGKEELSDPKSTPPAPEQQDHQSPIFETLSPFEEINRKTLVLNELSLSTDPIYLAYRGYHLLKYFSEHPELGPLVDAYLQELYRISYPEFIYELTSRYFANNKDGQNDFFLEMTGRRLDTTMLFSPDAESEPMFQTLSQVLPNEHPIRLTSIRKYPFHHAGRYYLAMDMVFMLEKGYNQFLNDFWFDRIKGLKNEKGKAIFPIKRYRGIFGEFLENYLDSALAYSFANARHFHLFKFNDLNIFADGQNVQLLDVYIRNSDKIFLSEVKSTGIYDNEKYANDMEGFYRNDRDGFFNSFGMGQLIKAIDRLVAQARIFDPGFPRKGSIKVYPAIIVNERALQTPAMAKVFQDRFKELLPPGIDKRLKIQPLSIVHLTDWENMEDHLHEDSTSFFKIMKFQVRNPQFMPPFYNTLAIQGVKKPPRKAMALLEEIVQTYQRPQPSTSGEMTA